MKMSVTVNAHCNNVGYTLLMCMLHALKEVTIRLERQCYVYINVIKCLWTLVFERLVLPYDV